jgi:hypothetical protein
MAVLLMLVLIVQRRSLSHGRGGRRAAAVLPNRAGKPAGLVKGQITCNRMSVNVSRTVSPNKAPKLL